MERETERDRNEKWTRWRRERRGEDINRGRGKETEKEGAIMLSRLIE